MTCNPHNDATKYRTEPDPKRKGWERVTCSECGEFVGYRPKAQTTKEIPDA